MSTGTLFQAAKTGTERGKVKKTASDYRAKFDAKQDIASRKENSQDMVNDFYDMVTDFYEYGWGQSFHFAPRLKNESFDQSIKRHEYYLAARAGAKKGMKMLDVGCGVGGPARNIVAFSGADVVGLNNNEYQLKLADAHTEKAGLQGQCSFIHGDFMNIRQDEATYDAAYAIESTCHASDRTKTFSEVGRVLKKGGLFVGYEWCTTDAYNPDDAGQKQIIRNIEEGNGLPELTPIASVKKSLEDAGFEDVECWDMAEDERFSIPWYHAISGKDKSFASKARTPLGRFTTHAMVSLMEFTRIAPRGSVQVSKILNLGADALVEGGEKGLFSPMIFFSGRKPA
jgi:sterol 24-C-methyltransferase